jgi:repressor LexA
MVQMTTKQRLLLEFIRSYQEERGYPPTRQEIADHFGFCSPNSVTEHVRLIRQKGYLTSQPRRARSLRVMVPSDVRQAGIMRIPVLGSIPAGFSENLEQAAIGCLSAVSVLRTPSSSVG